VMRVSGQGLLDHYWSTELSEGFAHQFVGMIMLVPAFFLILFVGYLLDKLFIEEADAEHLRASRPPLVPATPPSASPAMAVTASSPIVEKAPVATPPGIPPAPTQIDSVRAASTKTRVPPAVNAPTTRRVTPPVIPPQQIGQTGPVATPSSKSSNPRPAVNPPRPPARRGFVPPTTKPNNPSQSKEAGDKTNSENPPKEPL